MKNILVTVLLLAMVEAAKPRAPKPNLVPFQSQDSVKFERHVCSKDPKLLCQKIVCDMKTISPTVVNMTLECHLKKPLQKLWVAAKNFKLSRSRIYQPLFFNFKENFCNIIGSANVFINQMFPDLVGQWKKYLHPCPYNGSIVIVGMTVDMAQLAKFLPTGSYKLNFQVTNENNEMAYEGDSFLSVNSKI